jgi:transposase-like protein
MSFFRQASNRLKINFETNKNNQEHTPIHQFSNGRPRVQTDDELLYWMYKRNIPISQIAKMQKISESTVRRRIKKQVEIEKKRSVVDSL